MEYDTRKANNINAKVTNMGLAGDHMLKKKEDKNLL
jgi:hypothetical protein